MAKKTKAAPAEVTREDAPEPSVEPAAPPSTEEIAAAKAAALELGNATEIQRAAAPNLTRFDGIKFDQDASTKHTILKSYFVSIGDAVEAQLTDCHTRRRVLEHLEDAFRLVGAAIRDEQKARGGA